MEPELSAAARRHIRGLLRVVRPAADHLEQQYTKLLRRERCDATRLATLLALTPAAASRHRTLPGFFRQVEISGRAIANLNVPRAEAIAHLGRFGALLEQELGGEFAPAREQLELATVMVLNRVYYEVREAEARCFYGLYRAETEAADLDGLLRRFVQQLAHTFGARAGRLVLEAGETEGGPFYREGLDAGAGCACEWSYPIGRSAVLHLGFSAKRRWLPREESLLRAAGDRFSEAFERVRMRGEVRRLDAEARRAEEDERRRLGRELHDEIGQSLLLLRLELELLERESPEALRVRLRGARGIAERSIEELRRIVSALSPAVLERLGLEVALRQLAARFQKRHGAAVRMRIASDWKGLSREQEQVIYRVAQEAFQNVSKHSGATRVNFFARSTDRVIRLSVTDNGSGFSTEEAVKNPMTFGLGGMRERAGLLGGTLKIRSAPGAGTAVKLELPYSATVAPNGKDAHHHH